MYCLCGNPKSARSKRCLDCGIKSRVFRTECLKCGNTFESKNGRKTYYCSNCALPSFCLGCGKSLRKKYNSRCNSCEALGRHQRGVYSKKGWKRYEYSGIRYRSSWEVEFAKELDKYGVVFEYERYDKQTKTFPDFYFPDRNLYIEIHPREPEKKKVPENCIILTEQKHYRSFAKLLGLKQNKEMRDKEMAEMPLKQLIKEYENSIDTFLFLCYTSGTDFQIFIKERMKKLGELE